MCKCEANEHCMNTHTNEQIEDEGTQEYKSRPDKPYTLYCQAAKCKHDKGNSH